MNYTFIFHELKPLADLFRYYFELMRVECLLRSLVQFLILVQVETQAVKNDDDVLSEPEVINHLDQAVNAFIVYVVRLLQFFEEANLDIGIVNVELFVLAYLCGYDFLIWVFVINTFYDLAEGAFVDESDYFVAVADLLARLQKILSILISN